MGYQVVLSRLRGSHVSPETDPVELGRIVSDLFPTHPPVSWPETGDLDMGMSDVERVTPEELKEIAPQMATRKAPGLDEIPNAAVKVAIEEYSGVFCCVYQDCLDTGTFSQQWKRQHLVLLPKPKYLPAPGKAAPTERLILNRLNKHLEDPDSPQLYDAQYGFRRGRNHPSSVPFKARWTQARRPEHLAGPTTATSVV